MFGEKKSMRNMAAGPLTVLVVDQPLSQIGDVLLSASGRVQRAAHLGETPIDVSAEITEVLTKGVETRRCSVSEVADLGSDLFHGCLQCVNAPLEILLTHVVKADDLARNLVAHLAPRIDWLVWKWWRGLRMPVT